MDRFMNPPKPTKWRVAMGVFVVAHVAVALIVGPLTVVMLAIVETALTSWVFIFLYFPKRWTETSMGVQLMSMALLFALVSTLALLPESFGFDGVLKEWVSVLVMTAMPVLMLNMIRVLLRVQREDRLKTKKKKKRTTVRRRV